MKQVVLNYPIKYVTPDYFDGDKYYGFESPSGGKGFLVQGARHKTYTVFAENGFTHSNKFPLLTDIDDAKHLLRVAIDNRFEVFEFDTSKELFKWLAE